MTFSAKMCNEKYELTGLSVFFNNSLYILKNLFQCCLWFICYYLCNVSNCRFSVFALQTTIYYYC